MTDSEIQGASRPTRRLILVAVVVWVVLVFALPLAALTFNAVKLAGFPLGFWITAQGVLLGLAALGLVFASRAGGERSANDMLSPLVFAGEAIGAAGFLGFAGAIAALGYDGLAYPLGLAAGFALLVILKAPRFVLYPARSIGGYFFARYGGIWPRRLALIISAIAAILLLAADMRGGALAVQGLVGADYAIGVAAVAVSLTIVWLAGSLLPERGPYGIVYGFVLACFLIALFAFAVHQGRLPWPYAVTGYALNDLAGLDQKLIVDKLANVNALKPMTSPFLQLSMASFAGIVLALALGIAAAPHLLGRHVSQGVVAAGEASRRTALALVFVVIFLLGPALMAVMARFAFEAFLAGGIETAALPPPLVRANALGWLQICGSNAFSGPDLAAACSKVPGHRGFLRLQDVAFTTDGFIFAAPMIASLPLAAFLLFLAGAFVAANAAGRAVLSGLIDADSEARSTGAGDVRPLNLRSVVLAVGLLLAALLVAMLGTHDIASLASEGLALIASGLFPALVLGLYWRRMTAAGAIAAMVTGFTLAGLYIAGARLFPVQMFDWTGPLSNAAPGAVRKFADLKAAAVAATSGDLKLAADAALVQHAAGIANWWGLKPAAITLLAVPVAFLAGAIASVIVSRTAKGAVGPQ